MNLELIIEKQEHFKVKKKPHIERLFGRFQRDFITALPNFIGANVAERKAIESIKSFEERLYGNEEILYMKPERFQAFCNWWLETQYMDEPHHGLSMRTPSSMLEGFIPKLPAPEQVYKLNLMLEPLAGLRVVVKKGIRVENAFYFETPLVRYVGEEVQVRLDRFDMGKIYVFDKQNNFICEAVNYELLGKDKPAFIEQVKIVENEVIKERRRKTRRIMNKSKLLDYVEPIQIDLEEAIENAKNKEVLNGTNLKAIENKPFEFTEEQKIIQQEIAEDLEFVIPDDKDQEFKLFLEYKSKEIQGEQLNERIINGLEQYPESTAGRVRIKFMLEHEEVKNLYKASTRVLQNLETLINV